MTKKKLLFNISAVKKNESIQKLLFCIDCEKYDSRAGASAPVFLKLRGTSNEDKMTESKLIMDSRELERKLNRLSTEIVDETRGGDNLALIGIRTMGAHLAERIKKKTDAILSTKIPLGILDITLYRDDFSRQPVSLAIKETIIDFDLTGKHIVLIDDVLWSGRTVRAALDHIMDYGRPSVIRLAVLIDRGGRELPIEPTFTGARVEVREEEWIELRLRETGSGRDEVLLKKGKKPGNSRKKK